MAMAFKLRREPRVAMTFFGEGSTANGQWHEAMNLAGVQRLPVVFVLENNGFAYSTPNSLEFAVDPVERAAGYGFPGVAVDGNDVEAVFAAAAEAAERARAGGGPTLIEARTMRMHGHGAHDDMSYVPEEMLAEWRDRDPIDRYTRAARRRARRSTRADRRRSASEVAAEVAAAAEARARLADAGARRSPRSRRLRRPSGGRWATARRRGPATPNGGGGMSAATQLEPSTPRGRPAIRRSRVASPGNRTRSGGFPGVR